MMIPITPVRRSFQGRRIEQKDVLRKPFPFMSGAQALFSCAREAFLCGIRLLGYTPKKVHVPAYCCQSILSPLEKLELDVRFYDVGKRLEPIVDNIKFNKGDIFLLVHYFGIPQDTPSINRLCQEFGMVLVEDCAHALPDPENKHTMGSIGVFSIYSLRKQLPVPDGGVLVVNDPQIRGRMTDLALPRPRRISAKRWLVTNLDRLAFATGWLNTLVLKDFLRNLIGSTDNVFHRQLSDDAVPEISPITLRVLGQMDIETIVRIRRKNYRCLVDHLSGLRGVTVPFPFLLDGAVPQAFPILLKDADRVCMFMHKRGMGVGRWPGIELPKLISLSDFPGTSSWVESLILLPSHQDLNVIHIEEIVRTIREAI